MVLALRLAAGRHTSGPWRAGGIMPRLEPPINRIALFGRRGTFS